jgi:hypothetical protein
VTDSDRAVVELALGLIETHGFARGGMKPETGLGVAAALSLVATDELSAIRAAALIREANGIDRLVDWELEPGRTQAEVVAALERAAGLRFVP